MPVFSSLAMGTTLVIDAELDRQLGSAAAISSAGAPPAAALQALEQYKKKDSSKGV